MKGKREHLGFIVFFASVIMIFLWKIIIMKGGFIDGDYLAQFYPWSKIYSEALKNMGFPFWTRYFQSGFPLIAEGQVGGFYPLNIAFFFLLPFRIAYNYIVVVHFVLAGVFTYMYTRKLGACEWGGSIAALLFCFGSAYAGCFYNTVTVKTLIWFPMVLFLFEKYFEGKKARYVVISGIILGLQLLAGFAQLAIYSALFYVLYFFSGLLLRKDLEVRDAVVLGFGMFIAFVIFYPQFSLSWPLASLSGRADATLDFALWGSFSPLYLTGLVFPYWIFTGMRIYIGIFSLLFLIMAFTGSGRTRRIGPLTAVLVVSFLLALGKYNPLYVLALKVSGLFSFRNPSKFLFFGMFAASVLSGYGFTEFFEVELPRVRAVALRIFSVLIGAILAVFFLARAVILLFGDRILSFGEWYVTNHIYGKEFHRYSLDAYIQKVRSFYDTFLEVSAVSNPYNIFSIVMCLLAFAVSWHLLKKRRLKPLYKWLFAGLIFVDIVVLSFYGTGFRGNIKDFDRLTPGNRKLFDIVKNTEGVFRILPYDLASGRLPDWSMPNLNAAYGIDSVGVYTPLAPSSYKDKLKDLEVVDDSLGLLSPSHGAFEKDRDIIRFLNVRYIVSAEELDDAYITERSREDGVYLYELKGFLPRGYMVDKLQGQAEVIDLSEMDQYMSGIAVFSIKAKREGFFIFSEFNYPGWKATVDGKDTEILPFRDILMAVRILQGEHKVIFRYFPWKSGLDLGAEKDHEG